MSSSLIIRIDGVARKGRGSSTIHSKLLEIVPDLENNEREFRNESLFSDRLLLDHLDPKDQEMIKQAISEKKRVALRVAVGKHES